MTMTMKTTKNEMIEILTKINANFDETMTKKQLFEIYENALNEQIKNVELSQQTNVVDRESEIMIIENNENNDNSQNYENTNVTMFNEYIDFLKNENAIFKIEHNVIIVMTNKKHIFVKIDNDKNYSHVFTILNNKISNDMIKNRLHARNILTLKSLKATKSYTISNMK